MKTQSQQIARGFEILGYVFLGPALISLIFPVIFFLSGMANLKLEVILFGLVPIAIATPGMFLLVGYNRHSRGLLNEDHIGTLWFWTIIYNGLLALPWLAYLGYEFQNERELPTYIFSIITAYVALITLAVIGLRDHVRSELS
jgi:hypothetical protein